MDVPGDLRRGTRRRALRRGLGGPEPPGPRYLTAIIRDRAFVADCLAGFASGWFIQTRMPAAGRRWRVVLQRDEVTVLLIEAPVRPVATGDAFELLEGCDQRLETCRARFPNVANFLGFPHIPGQDAVIAVLKIVN